VNRAVVLFHPLRIEKGKNGAFLPYYRSESGGMGTNDPPTKEVKY
jgi:hypothetical protein